MLHRPRTAVTKAAVILGLYVVAGLGAAAMPFARLPGELPAIAVVVLLVAAFVVGQQLVWYNGWIQIGGVLAAAVFVICTGLAAHSSVLSWHGDRIEAVVTGVSVTRGSHGSTTYHYVLVDDQQRPIPGHLSEDDPEFDRGERVTVVVDRHNWVDPETSGEVGAARPLWIAALTGLALTTILSVLGGRSQGSGRAPRSGPGGVWIFDR
ncbi:hypothetical protein [Dactylosporangium darangshiense]|uniref:hypothetical protein n=1 Tax=Dactylosporangium darangshiense TaxID=579108 RepID=UPI0031F0F9E3